MPFDESFMSERAKQLAPSGIRKFFDLAAKMPNAINLSLGQADFDVPQAVKKAAIDAIQAGHNRYTQTAGLQALKDKTREYLQRTQTLDTTNDEVIISGGCSGGLLLSYLCLLDRGDEVLIPDPFFIEYLGQASMVGATPVFYNTFPDWRLRVEELEKVRTPRSKVLIVNSPQNPTGTMYTADELKAVAEWARAHRIFVISDEIYDLFAYDSDRPHVSIKRFYPEGTALVGGLSKSYGMPGWRLGYALVPTWMHDKAVVMQSYSFVCAPTPFQWAGIVAFDVDMSAEIAAYRHKRDMVYDALREYYPCEKPPGSFYIFPEIPESLRPTFMDKVIEHQLLVVPGPAFSPRQEITHFRLSFAATDETLQRGLDSLRQIAESNA